MKFISTALLCTTLAACQPAYSEMNMQQEALLSEQTVRYICSSHVHIAGMLENKEEFMRQAERLKGEGMGEVSVLARELYSKDIVKQGERDLIRRLQKDVAFCKQQLKLIGEI